MENNSSFKYPVPNATGVLVLGILSIVFCWCYGLVGVILGVVALILAHTGNKAYITSPSSFSESSYKNLKAGKICAIIGLSISGLIFILMVIAVLSEIANELNIFNYM